MGAQLGWNCPIASVIEMVTQMARMLAVRTAWNLSASALVMLRAKSLEQPSRYDLSASG